MEPQKKNGWLNIGTPQCGVAFAVVGALLALMLLFLGFWRTLLVALFAGAGYFLGASEDKGETLKKLINRLFPPKGE